MRDLSNSIQASSNPVDFLSFRVSDAEKEVKEAAQKDMERQNRSDGVATGSAGRQIASSSGFTFDFPSQSAASTSTSTSRSSSDSNGSTPHRRRSAAPTSIPNFPSASQPRDSPFSPSPTESPAGRSPTATPPQPTSLGRLPPPTFSMNGHGVEQSGMPSPWHMLAASSGAPTPSIDGPGRGSPHLGSPFERLNIGGSWSGANLDQAGSGKGASAEPPSLSLGLSTSPGKSLYGPTNGFSFGTETKPPLGAPASGHDDNRMYIDPPGASASSSKKPALPPTLALRRASLPKNHVNFHSPPIAKSSSPLATSPSPGPPTKPRALIVSQLGPVLSKPTTLVLDVRPPSSYQASHLPESHSLPVPSTLLRRPAFTIQKLTQMLSKASMEAVSQWRGKSDIVLVDQDSGSVPDGSVLDGLAAKFAREGFSGHLWFVKGGHRAVQTSGSGLIGDSPGDDNVKTVATTSNGGLMAGGMGRFAFQQGSTGGGLESPGASKSTRNNETPGFALRLNPFDDPSSPKSPSSSKRPSLHGAMSSINNDSRTLQPANPFFDNIRQNLELSHGGITERIPLQVAPEIVARAHELPPFLCDLVTMSEKEGADKLANQFYELELGEQRRLQAVMNWHSEDSGAIVDGVGVGDRRSQHIKDKEEVDRLAAWGVSTLATRAGQMSPDSSADQEQYFPFSITAGVERGTKNRYKNIWPYDFSRVRLGAPADDSDYINASFVQPRGTSRRYIATQGPLDATYCDFWTLIWEQDVRVIVMITKQFEGGSIKCGNYWEEQRYGPVRLKLVSQTGGEDQKYQASTGFDFGIPAPSPREQSDKPASHIKRVFQVTHDDHPGAASREIVQIQCVSWPDFNVPESADVLLSLVREVDAAFSNSCGTAQDSDRQDDPPVLVHCSAGVGRTGSFIVVDAILDGLRREHKLPSLASALPAAPAGGSTPSQSSTSHASSGEKGVPLAQSAAEKHDSIGHAIPELEESAARATDQQYTTDSFKQHRGHHTASISSGYDEHARRPSLSSVIATSDGHVSEFSHDRRSDRLSDISEHSMGMPQPVTSSGVRHRAPTPLSEMENPILDVLSGMRVQRMSLVQSLRQYVFVYRAIITAYISLLDESRSRVPSRATDTTSVPPSASATSITIPTFSSDEDIHSKRRASPTELVPDKIAGFDFSANDDIEMGQGGGSNLVKRPSFKKMRSSAVEGISLASARGGSGSSAGGASPKKGSGGGSGQHHHPVAK